MLSFFRWLLGIKEKPNHNTVNWVYYYYNNLNSKVKCIIFEDKEDKGLCVVYNENKCMVTLKRSDLLELDYFDGNDHRFI